MPRIKGGLARPTGAAAPPPPPDGPEAPRPTGGSDHHPEIDWVAAGRSPEFRELVLRKRSFVVPGTIFFLAWYFGFVLLAGYAPDFMGRELLVDGITVGYALALSQFVMTWVLVWWYLRRADRAFDPLARKAARRALESAHAASATAPSPHGEVHPR